MFAYSHNDYYCEQVPLADLAHEVGTPAYVYSSRAILQSFAAYNQAFGALPHNVCYAVKANSSLAVLALLAKRARASTSCRAASCIACFRPAAMRRSGFFRRRQDCGGSGIRAGERHPHVQLRVRGGTRADRREGRAAGARASFSIRVNPDVDAVTHPYISTGLSQHKFGIDIAEAAAVYERSRQYRNLEAQGVSCHIGSQILDPSPILEALDKVLALAESLRAQGHPIRHLDLGGGLGVAYHAGETSPDIGAFVAMISQPPAGQRTYRHDRTGRSIVGRRECC